MARKVYVAVDVHFDTEGKMLPLRIFWEDGTVYDVDRVSDVRRSASLKAGGQGIRYTIRVKGKQTYLYYENPQWFVEGKEIT